MNVVAESAHFDDLPFSTTLIVCIRKIQKETWISSYCTHAIDHKAKKYNKYAELIHKKKF
jgi:hypothetical protein